MPFTPFHFGPGILLGLLLLKYLDFPTFVAANVMIDWRAALVFLGLLDGPLHGWVHTYLGASLMALSLGGAMIYMRPWMDEALREMKIKQKFSRQKIFIAAFSGAFLHITIDALHHPYMQPFFPLDIRPLFGLASTFELRAVTFAMLIAGTVLYLVHVSSDPVFQMEDFSGE